MTKRLSLVFFLLLFPILFFYSSAVGSGLMRPVLGGGFGFLAITAFAAMVPIMIVDIPKQKGTSLYLTLLFFSLIIYSFSWMMAHLLLDTTLQGRTDVTIQWVTLITTWLVMFSIGYFWPTTLSNKYLSVLFLCLFSMSAVVLTNIDITNLIFMFGISGKEGALTYQGLARSVTLTGLVLLSVLRNIRASIIVATILLVTVFFIGARSELVGTLFVLPFIAYMHFRQRPKTTVIAFLIVGLLLSGATIYAYDRLSVSRQFNLFNISQEESGSARIRLQEQAWEKIKISPIFGDFSGQIKINGDIGEYSHNIISAWRQLGLAGAMIYLSLIITSLSLSIIKLRDRRYSHTDLPRIATTISLYCLFLILVAKPVFWSLPALAWGLTAACYRPGMSFPRRTI